MPVSLHFFCDNSAWARCSSAQSSTARLQGSAEIDSLRFTLFDVQCCKQPRARGGSTKIRSTNSVPKLCHISIESTQKTDGPLQTDHCEIGTSAGGSPVPGTIFLPTHMCAEGSGGLQTTCFDFVCVCFYRSPDPSGPFYFILWRLLGMNQPVTMGIGRAC